MNFPWVISIAPEDTASLATLRLLSGIEVGEAAGLVWVRGQSCDKQLSKKILALPTRGRYERLKSNQLRHIQQRIPSAALPDLRWQPLDIWLQVKMPAAALPANIPDRISLRLARSTEEREAELLITR